MPRTLRWEPPSTPFQLRHVEALGVTPRILEHAARTGRVTRLAHGVYVGAADLPTDATAAHLQRALAHQLARPELIASHATAALAWCLDLDDPDATASGMTRFVRPPGAAARAEPGPRSRVTVRDVPRDQRARHPSGLVVTTPARAAVEVASELQLPEALVTLDAAARLLLAERAGSRWVRGRHRDSRSIAAALAPLHAALPTVGTRLDRRALQTSVDRADPRRESAAESLSFGHMVLAGLPLPELQVRLIDEHGEMYPDFRWPWAMVIGEVDGKVKYRTPDDLVAERRRQARLERLGYAVVRWEAGEIRSRPAMVVRRIGAALERRSGLGPAG